METQMWAAVLGDFLFSSWGTAGRCKVVSEMNLQLANIIGEIITNLADFCPFVSLPLNSIINWLIHLWDSRDLRDFWYQTLHKLNIATENFKTKRGTYNSSPYLFIHICQKRQHNIWCYSPFKQLLLWIRDTFPLLILLFDTDMFFTHLALLPVDVKLLILCPAIRDVSYVRVKWHIYSTISQYYYKSELSTLLF